MKLDLGFFCGPKVRGYGWLRKPFVLGGWRYASNGWIAVREPRLLRLGSTRANGEKSGQPASLFENFQPERCTEPLPVHPGTIEEGICCDVCDIWAHENCWACIGGSKRTPLKIGTCSLAGKMIVMLHRMPGVLYDPTSNVRRKDKAVELVDSDGRQIIGMPVMFKE
jgi:hypothetical protein